MSKLSVGVLAVYQQGQASSLIAVVVSAILSIVAVGLFFVHVSWISVHVFLATRGVAASQRRRRSFFQTQLGIYTVSLLLSNFVASIAFLIDVRWIELKRVESGSLCDSQAVLKHIGSSATAYFTGAIAAHAFTSLICHRPMPRWFSSAAVAFGWVVSILIGALPLVVKSNKKGPAYGFDGLSCGISLRYPTFQVVLTTISGLLAILITVVVFWLIFLVLGGTLSTRQGLAFRFNFDSREVDPIPAGHFPQYHRFVNAVARSLVWYPIAYTLFSLPTLVVVMMLAAGDNVPFSLRVFADTSFAMLGLANSLVLLHTLRILSPYLVTQYSSADPLADSDSFYAPSASPVDPEIGATGNQQSYDTLRRPSSSHGSGSLMPIYANAPKRASLPVSVLMALVDAVSLVATSRKEPQKDFAPTPSTGNTTTLVSPLPLLLSIPQPIHINPRPPSILIPPRSTIMKPLPPSPRKSKSSLSRNSTIDVPPRSASSSFYERRQTIPEDIDPGEVQMPTKLETRPSTISISSMHEHMATLSPPPSRSPRFRSGELPSDGRQSMTSSTSPRRGLPANPRVFKVQQEMAQVSLPGLPAAAKHSAMWSPPYGKDLTVQRPSSCHIQPSQASISSSPAKVTDRRPLPRISMAGASALVSIPGPPAGTLAARRSVRTTVSAIITSPGGYI